MIDRRKDIKVDYDFAEIVWIEDVKIPDFYKLAFKYDVSEFTTSLKPFLTLKLLEKSDSVIFLDPDICLYSNLDLIYDNLINYPILLTPHYTVPVTSHTNLDLSMMRFGSFNLGFYAVNSDEEAKKFLQWWSKCCFDLCFFETQFGLSTDQKWVTIAPCFFPNLHIMFDPGLNMAFWNLHERTLKKDKFGYLVNQDFRLVFFHFSSFNLNDPKKISTRPHDWIVNGRDDLNEICVDYAEKLRLYDTGYSIVNYGFDYMDDGTYISPTLRRAYVAMDEYFKDVSNPFSINPKIKKFISKNYLNEKNDLSYRTANTSDIEDHKIKFKFIYFMLRIILRIVGPNQFYNLSRLMVYLSSYRLNKGLWKS